MKKIANIHLFFKQIEWIKENTNQYAALAQPCWMVIYNLHTECTNILQRFQRQPELSCDKALLQWAFDALGKLPSNKTEQDWPINISIPSLFKFTGQFCSELIEGSLPNVSKTSEQIPSCILSQLQSIDSEIDEEICSELLSEQKTEMFVNACMWSYISPI